MLYKGVHLNKEDTNDDSPTHLVVNIFSKNPDRCAYILKMVIYGARVNQKNYDRWAPIYSAVRKSQEMAKNGSLSHKINKQEAQTPVFHRYPWRHLRLLGLPFIFHLAAMSS